MNPGAPPVLYADPTGDTYLWDPFGLFEEEGGEDDYAMVWDCPPYEPPPE